MARGTFWLLLGVAVMSATITWLLVRENGVHVALDDPDADAARIAELEAEVDRLVDRNRELQSISVDAPDRVPRADGRGPGERADGASPEVVVSNERLDFRTLERGPTIPKHVPPGMRGTPRMWIEGMRIALEKGDPTLATYYRMALVALGDEAIEPTLALLQNDGAALELRQQAIEALNRLDASGVGTVAADWLSRPRAASPLRTSMLQALTNADVKDVPKRVIDIAWDDEAVSQDRELALRATMRSAPDEASDIIRRFFRDGTDAERTIAHRVLRRARNPRMRPLIEEVMADSEPELQGPLMNTLAAMKGPGWGNEQMTGPPDTPTAGDNQTAWASRAAQEGAVQVELDFAIAVVPDAVRVHETYNAGAIVRVEALVGGRFVTIWQGDPGAAATPRWFAPPLAELDESVRTLRFTLDTDAVTGWNEIDAVELIGDGQRQWATGARSSSCYAHRE